MSDPKDFPFIFCAYKPESIEYSGGYRVGSYPSCHMLHSALNQQQLSEVWGEVLYRNEVKGVDEEDYTIWVFLHGSMAWFGKDLVATDTKVVAEILAVRELALQECQRLVVEAEDLQKKALEVKQREEERRAIEQLRRDYESIRQKLLAKGQQV